MCVSSTDTDECDSGDACCSQHCTNYPAGYECSCEPGYTLSPNGCTCDGVCVWSSEAFCPILDFVFLKREFYIWIKCMEWNFKAVYFVFVLPRHRWVCFGNVGMFPVLCELSGVFWVFLSGGLQTGLWPEILLTWVWESDHNLFVLIWLAKRQRWSY